MRLEEGKQYFVNRITFPATRPPATTSSAVRCASYEGGVFNTEALKYSVRRLNQLGYFKPLEGEAIDVQKTPDQEGKVDVRLKFEEQNRNQMTFGAGVSQYDGFFGQLAFQTSNFLGRGETFSVSAQQGNRAKNYQVGVHRAVPVRPADHRRRRRVQPGDPVHRPVHAGVDRHELGLGLPGGAVLALVRELQLPEGPGQGPEPAVRPAGVARRPIRSSPIRC